MKEFIIVYPDKLIIAEYSDLETAWWFHSCAEDIQEVV